MAHLGLLCFPSPGHVNPTVALARELKRRGHRVTIFQSPQIQEIVEHAGIGFRAIGGTAEQLQAARGFEQQLSTLTGLVAVRHCTKWFDWEARLFFAEAPAIIAQAGVEGLIIDQIEFHGLIIAKKLGLPHVLISNALPLNVENGVPPCYLNWEYSTGRLARARNFVGHALCGITALPLQRMLLAQARAWGVDPFERLEQVPHISQLPACLDFPRSELPVNFHYTGPFVEPELLASVPFPWDKLDGRPLVYASLGTTHNGSDRLYQMLANACGGLNAQIVLSMGRRVSVDRVGPLPKNIIAVPYVPQWELLARVSLVITHCGLNTVLHALLHGLPMVAVPIASDQPGVAARLARAGAAEVVPARQASGERLRSAIQCVFETPSYREAARRLRGQIIAADGMRSAAKIIEHYLPGKPSTHGAEETERQPGSGPMLQVESHRGRA